MRAVDKETLTYRPNIDYDIILSQSIKNKVHINPELMVDASDKLKDNIETHKTELLKEYEQYNPAIVIEKLNELSELKEDLLAELEIVGELQNQLDKDFGEDDYVHSIEDEVIHDSTVVIENTVEEIDNITDLIKDILDIPESDVGMADRINQEYEKIEDAVSKEKNEISFNLDYQLSDIERVYVDKLISDGRNNINSYDDYIKQIIEEYRDRGASGVDYDAMRSDTKKSFMALTVIEEMISLAKKALEVQQFNMSDLFDGLVDETLDYLVNHANRSDVKDMSELNFRKAVRDSNVIKDNMKRYNDVEFREALNKHVMELEKLHRRYEYTSEKEALEGYQPSLKIVALNNSTKSLVDSNWENILVDRISSTKALVYQSYLLLENALAQKEYSLMYRFADIIDREFDFEHKDKELKIFNTRNQIYSMR